MILWYTYDPLDDSDINIVGTFHSHGELSRDDVYRIIKEKLGIDNIVISVRSCRIRDILIHDHVMLSINHIPDDPVVGLMKLLCTRDLLEPYIASYITDKPFSMENLFKYSEYHKNFIYVKDTVLYVNSLNSIQGIIDFIVSRNVAVTAILVRVRPPIWYYMHYERLTPTSTDLRGVHEWYNIEGKGRETIMSFMQSP